MNKLKLSPLNNIHLRYQAKMVNFAGYQMPLNYPQGVIHEHEHCRAQVSLFDISHMGQALIIGPQSAEELEQLCPNHLVKLKPWQMRYSVLLNNRGGIIDDVVVIATNMGLMLIVNAACKEKDYDFLRQNLSPASELIELNEQALLALQGPYSETIMAKFSPKAAELKFMHACSTEILNIPCTVCRSGYTGEDGFEISVNAQFAEALARALLAEPSVELAGLGARDSLRIEAGLCLYGQELSESITPVNAGLKFLLHPTRSNYPAADLLQRQLSEGCKMQRVGLNIASKIPVRSGARLYDDQTREVGHVTSGTFSPSLGRPIAMAYVEPQYAKAGSLLMTQVRNHTIYVSVTELPFVPHRYRR